MESPFPHPSPTFTFHFFSLCWFVFLHVPPRQKFSQSPSFLNLGSISCHNHYLLKMILLIVQMDLQCSPKAHVLKGLIASLWWYWEVEESSGVTSLVLCPMKELLDLALSSLSLCFSVTMMQTGLFPCTPTMTYCITTGPKQLGQETMTETFKTMSQNKHFPFASCLPQVFCHSNGNWPTQFLYISSLDLFPGLQI